MSGHKKLTEMLIDLGVLQTESIIYAFDSVDRRNFLPESQKHRYLENRPIPIGHMQTNSQPFTVAFMLELLLPDPNDVILDVGSGSGWTAALLSKIVDENKGGFVFGVEKIPELKKQASDNLKLEGVENVEILLAGPKFGLPDKAPFDKILVSASIDQVPQDLINQLKTGGRMVIPINQSIMVIEKTSSGLKQHEFPGFSFVPLV